jgi:sialic acid synthase SpsE
LAKEMVQAAWESGADAVKIQSFETRQFLHPSHPTYDYDIQAELSQDQQVELWGFARQHGILMFATCEDMPSLNLTAGQDPPLI